MIAVRRKGEALVLGAFILFGIGARCFFLAGPMDEPSWRQTDTAYMALRMGREWPPELLHPKAPYRGPIDVKAAEFPIYPLVTGLLYKATGGTENLLAARLVTFAFFLGALGYFFKIVELLFDRRIAWFAVAAYLALPLGVFYSRAVHPDFCVIFFAHAYWYYALRFYRDGRWTWFAIASLSASAAFLMKAPYCFYFGLPLAAWVLYPREGRTLRNVATLGAMLAAPLALAWWFNEVRIALEAPHAESLIYPMKWTREFTTRWFFGTFADRLNPEHWMTVVRRAGFLVATPIGFFACLMALFVPREPEHRRGWLSLYALCLGVVIFGLTVFPHFSSTHDYYSLPLMAPTAILIALFLAFLAEPAGARGAGRLIVALGLSWAGAAYGLKRGSYFQKDWQRLEAGAAIRQLTQPGDLVVSSTLGRSTGWSDPRILHFADRTGWAIELQSMNADALRQYREHGARYVALLITPEYPVADDQFSILADFPRQVQPLTNPSGDPIGHLLLFDVRSPYPNLKPAGLGRPWPET